MYMLCVCVYICFLLSKSCFYKTFDKHLFLKTKNKKWILFSYVKTKTMPNKSILILYFISYNLKWFILFLVSKNYNLKWIILFLVSKKHPKFYSIWFQIYVVSQPSP